MKWVLRIGLGLVLLIGIAALFVYLHLNSIIRNEIQEQATASLNVPTTLRSASLSLLGGSLSLSDLEVGSPPNFSTPHTLTIDGCTIDVHYDQLRGSPIRINRVTIDKPTLFIQQSNLKLNFQALMDQMPRTPQGSGGEAKPPIKLIIDELDVTNAQVTFLPGLPGLDAQIPAVVPSLTLKNIGNANGSQNGAAIKDVVMQVITALAAKGGDIANLPTDLKLLLATNLSVISKQLGGDFGKQFQNLAGGLGSVLNGTGKAGTGAVQGVGNALNGLLGGDKKSGQ